MDESRKEVEKRLEKEIEKRVEAGVKRGTAILITVTIVFVMSMIIFKFVWAWVVPDLFPGAVSLNLISGDLTWFAALKLAVLVAVLSGFYPALQEAFKSRP